MKNNYIQLSGEELKGLVSENKAILFELGTEALGRLMNYETDLLCNGEGDIEFIKTVSDLLDERRKDSGWEQRFDKAIATARNDTYRKRKSKATLFKRISAIAATVAVIITVGLTVASNFGFNIVAYVTEGYTGRDPFVFYRGEGLKEYVSLKQMTEGEGLDIMYPAKLPKGTDIVSVVLEEKPDGKSTLRIETADDDVSVLIQIAMGEGLHAGNNMGTHLIDGCNYYVFNDKINYYAFCYYKDDYYSFMAKSYGDLMLIIENMEK